MDEGAETHRQECPANSDVLPTSTGELPDGQGERLRVRPREDHRVCPEGGVVVAEPLDLRRPVALDGADLVNEPPAVHILGDAGQSRSLRQLPDVVLVPSVGCGPDDRARLNAAINEPSDRLFHGDGLADTTGPAQQIQVARGQVLEGVRLVFKAALPGTA
jgi:hypothetical protein